MRAVLQAFALLIVCANLAVLRAQYGSGMQMPSIHRKKSQANGSDANRKRTIEADGQVRSNDGKNLVVAVGDGRTLTLAISGKTVFSHDGKTVTSLAILPRSTVHVEAEADDQDNLSALQVNLLKPPSLAESSSQGQPEPDSAAAQDSPSATILQSPVDAPHRPVLRRGASPEQHEDAGSDDTSSAAPKQHTKTGSASSPVAEDDGIIVEPDPSIAPSGAKPKSTAAELLARSKDWAANFATLLPNFVCNQSTTRYVEESKQEGWRALDVITAQVVYEDGKESYRDITVGGRKTSKSMLDLGGNTSSGEYATTLRSIFSPASRADFKFYRTAMIGDASTSIYDFKVALRNSNWQVRVGGQTLLPAYSGSVWIDKSTAQVRRIEMQADQIPADFPLDSVQWAVDYSAVSLGSSSFWLPVHAENLGCQRGSSVCTKNAIDFRNYHKFSGESTIDFSK
jgi:hypothetical protein